MKWTSVSMVTVTTLHFITLAVMARILLPTDFGLMGMIMVVIGFAHSFADMGISKAIIHRQDTTREELSSLYWLNILAGIVVFLVVCLSTPLIVWFYHEPRLYNLLYLTAVIFLIIPIGNQFQILLQKKLKFNSLAKIEIVTAFANSVVAISSALVGFGVYALVFGQLSSVMVKVILLLSQGWQQWGPSFHFSKQDTKGYLGFGLYQMGEKSINYLNSNLDYLIIGSMLGAKELGYYTLAYNLIIKPYALVNPIVTKVAFPIFSRIQNETNKLRSGYLKTIQILSTVNFPIMIGLAVIAPVAIPVLFGEEWIHSIVLIQILVVVGLLRSTGNPVGALLLAKGRADLGFKWNLCLTVTQIPGLYIGAKLGGSIGIAVAFSCLMVIYSIFNYTILIRTLIGPCLRKYILSMWPALWLSLMMGTTVLLIYYPLRNSSNIMILATQIIVGIITYVTLTVLFQRDIAIEIKSFF